MLPLRHHVVLRAVSFLPLTVALAVGAAFAQRPAHPVPDRAADGTGAPLAFTGSGHTVYGDWRANVTLDSSLWRAKQAVALTVDLQFPDTQLAAMAGAGIKADKLCVLVTAERTFDADGWMRLPSDERMSTLLTPAGLAIEGGVQGAMTTRYGYQFKAPLDQLVTVTTAQLGAGSGGTRLAAFPVAATLPADLPPGLYRLRFDFGVLVGTRVYNFNGFTFAARPFSSEAGTVTYFYSPVIEASGTHAAGRHVDAARIQPRFPWLLLSNYNSNGYRGVVPDEDARRFATSDRSLIPDDVILPMYDEAGTTRLSYSLEPQFPADGIDAYQNVAWNYASGEWSVKVSGPDGSTVDLGTSRFVVKSSGTGPTTKVAALTAWKPQAYGRYVVTATGWIQDQQGRRYEGGGTYRFWIAKRMTLATATFQGMPYPVGSSYGRDIQFNPGVPADVQVTARLFVNSDARDVRSVSYSGKATTAGLFGAAQGMKSLPLDAPGEYHAQVLATYTDADSHLWVSTMRHAGVVYPESSPVIARGKKRSIGGKYVERGETKFEGYVDADGEQHLDHITFPYLAGDVLLIAAEGQGANKIEPVLTYQMQGDTSAWDTRLNGVGTTNLKINTSNGYSPHMYPEYITDIEYFYGAAPRPGFMGRFVVGETNLRAPYWPVSPNSFGSQIGASPNGDAPGDIYRLLGGVVLRRAGQAPMYSGYIASAFLLPGGTNNNRIVAAGSEDLYGPLGDKARFFLVGLRPGTAYEVGATFRPALQIDPILPVAVHFVLTYPDGRQVTADGTGDKFGSFAGPTAWPLDVPGVYRYQVNARWNGYDGGMPGLPASGGTFFVYSKTRPAGAAGLRIDGASQRTFSATTGVTISGTSAAAVVRYTLITPGAVIDQGEIPVRGGKFMYTFDPNAAHAKVPLYDVVSITTGKPQIGRVIHLTFFSEEKAGATSFCDVARVILRGTTAITARGTIPATANASPGAGRSSSFAAPLELGASPVASMEFAAGVAMTAGVGPSIASSRVGQSSLAAEALARAGSFADLRSADTEIDRLLRRGDLVLISREADHLLDGRTHERLQQLHEGIPVVGGQLTRELENGVTRSVFATLYRNVTADAAPQVSADAARSIVERAAGLRLPPLVAPLLVILPTTEAGYVLAWRVEAAGTRDERRVSFVGAADGSVVQEYSARHRPLPAGGLADPAGGSDSAILRELLDEFHVDVGQANAQGRDRDEFRQAMRRALVNLVPSGASLSLARAATRQSAAELFGPDSAARRQVEEFWKERNPQ